MGYKICIQNHEIHLFWFQACQKHSFCPGGTSSEEICPENFLCPLFVKDACPSNVHCEFGQMVECPTGYYCLSALEKIACPKGYFCKGNVKSECTTEHYCPSETLSQPVECTPGHFCTTKNLIEVSQIDYLCWLDIRATNSYWEKSLENTLFWLTHSEHLATIEYKQRSWYIWDMVDRFSIR